MKGRNQIFEILTSLLTVFFIIISAVFFFKSELALAFLGSHPLEMSFRRAIKIDPENAAHPFALGILREKNAESVQEPIHRKQRYQDALGAIEKAIKLDPYQLSYRVSYSEIALKSGFPEKGEQVLQDQKLPFDFELYLARSYYNLKRADLSQNDSEKNKFLKQGIDNYKKVSLIAGDFAKQVFKRKVKTLSPAIQSELTQLIPEHF